MDPIIQQSLVILFLPLLSYVLTFFFGERLPRRGDFIGVGLMGAALVLSVRIFLHFWQVNDPSFQIEANWNWFTISQFKADVGVLVDGMTAVMLVVVCLVSFLVHLFSTGYMAGDTRYSRYFAFLGWFTFSMLGIVLANNLFFLYIFWELVGIASYLLIGFFFTKNSAANANKKAFLTNRVGDYGFWVGILMFFTAIGSFNYNEVFAGVDAGLISGTTLTIAGILLFMGAVGKSAQVPLHIWLPDAMEGPTPVSALIHAATMVAAGVYMTARLFPMFSPDALYVIMYTGAITALLAATIAIVQTDIKKGLAYSTISQLGFMVTAVGAGGVVAGMFHLATHAMFKALLFLGAGAVIHAMHHEQDMRKMGGLRHKLPITFATFTIATIAIAGVPPLAGFFSKDAILASALAFAMENPGHYGPFILALIAAGCTAFYMSRIVFLTFFGKPRDQAAYDHAHEVGPGMAIPLIVLAVMSIIAGGLSPDGSKWFDRFVGQPGESSHASVMMVEEPAAPGTLYGSLMVSAAVAQDTAEHGADSTAAAVGHTQDEGHGDAGHVDEDHAEAGHGEIAHADDHHDVEHIAHQRATIMSLLAAGLGLLLSFLTYQLGWINSAAWQARFTGLYEVWHNKYWFDEFYRDTFVRGTLMVATLTAAFDKYVVDGLVNGVGYANVGLAWFVGKFDHYIIDGLVNGTAEMCRAFGAAFRTLQTGRIQAYLFGLVAGLVVLIIVYRVAWPS